MSKRKYPSSFSTSNAKENAENNVRFWCNPRKQMFGSSKQTDATSATATASGSATVPTATASAKNIEYEEEWCEPINKNDVSAATFDDALPDRKTCERICHTQAAQVPLDLKNITGNYLSETAIRDSSIADKFLDKEVVRFRNALAENFPYLLDFNIKDKRYREYLIKQDLLTLSGYEIFARRIQWIHDQLGFSLYLKFRGLEGVDPNIYKRDLENVQLGGKISLEPYVVLDTESFVPKRENNDDNVSNVTFSVYPHNNNVFLNELMFDIYAICHDLSLCSFYNMYKLDDNSTDEMEQIVFKLYSNNHLLEDSIRMIMSLQDPNDYDFQTLVLDQTVLQLNFIAPYLKRESKTLNPPIFTNLYKADFTPKQFQSLLYRQDFIEALTKIRKYIDISMFPWIKDDANMSGLFALYMFGVLVHILRKDANSLHTVFDVSYYFNLYLEVLCHLDLAIEPNENESHYKIIFSLIIEYYLTFCENQELDLQIISGYLEWVVSSIAMSKKRKELYVKIVEFGVENKNVEFSKKERELLEEYRFYRQTSKK